MAYAYGYALDTRGGIKSIPDECCSRCQLRAQLAADGETDPQGKPLSTCTLWSAAIRTTDGRQFVNCSFYPEGKVVKVKGEFSCVLGRPVEAENILETNQPTLQPLITDHSLMTDHYHYLTRAGKIKLQAPRRATASPASSRRDRAPCHGAA
jgi:hypothetical protein